MLLEQSVTVKAFREAYHSKERIVLYGTGINAEAIVKECKDYQILGLMDASKTGVELWGMKVLTEEEILSQQVQKIVIVARPAVHSIIYKRIKKFVEHHNIQVYDIYGNDVAKQCNKQIEDCTYFHISYEDMWTQIETHEVISFDIFDTLLCRKTYQAQDVFKLMKSDDICNNFVQVREIAESMLIADVDIYEIYNYIQKVCKLTDVEMKELLSRELEKEKQVLSVRKSMAECLQKCIHLGKQVYLVSDMYLPKDLLKNILEQKGITGYKDLIISCEYGVSKANGLFDVLKSKIGIKSCLHIGDNHERDYVCAIQAGLDAFEISSPIKMMEMSTYKSWLSYTNSIDNRVLIGILASVIFNNPFSLFESKGKPCIEKYYEFGYIFIAPLVVVFISWLIKQVDTQKNAVVLFAARDGYLFQKVYQHIKIKLALLELPEDIYFFISRRAITDLNKVSDNEDRKFRYLEYIKSKGILNKEKIFFVDFMSKGTCQLGLEKLIGKKLHGIYVQRSYCNDDALNGLMVEALYKETSAMQKNRRIFAMCDFLECIFTSFKPSLKGFSESGGVIYEEETRSLTQLELVKELHLSILDFVNDYYNIREVLATDFFDVDFCDEILCGVQSEFARINLLDIENIRLDDAYGISKNVGIDVLQ